METVISDTKTVISETDTVISDITERLKVLSIETLTEIDHYISYLIKKEH